jgi:MFS family permease
MYSETDLEGAVAAGALTPQAAAAFRNHIAATRATPGPDEESFRLLTGFNDIFVAIAAVILLVAVGAIGGSIHDALGGAFVAATAWGLAEYFTGKRRMALPSILLLLAFVGGVFATQIGFLVEHGEQIFGTEPPERVMALIGGGMALVSAGAAWLHWRRFMVPITVAAGAAALAGTVIALVFAIIGDQGEEMGLNIILTLVFLAGLSVFAVAMRWDMSDRARETRRSDVAFWLHLLAAPMIAHPLFHWLGVTNGDEAIGPGAAFGVIAVYIAMGLVALAVDRRALLVSALAYVLAALTYLFREFGVVELNVAITALVIGSALLCLSAFWTPIRRAVVEKLPGTLQTALPLTHLKTA